MPAPIAIAALLAAGWLHAHGHGWLYGGPRMSAPLSPVAGTATLASSCRCRLRLAVQSVKTVKMVARSQESFDLSCRGMCIGIAASASKERPSMAFDR